MLTYKSFFLYLMMLIIMYSFLCHLSISTTTRPISYQMEQKSLKIQPEQHKKMTAESASVCAQRENREWKYQKMSVVGGLAGRFSGLESSTQQQLS